MTDEYDREALYPAVCDAMITVLAENKRLEKVQIAWKAINVIVLALGDVRPEELESLLDLAGVSIDDDGVEQLLWLCKNAGYLQCDLDQILSDEFKMHHPDDESRDEMNALTEDAIAFKLGMLSI
jgi:hypothetical protein